MERIPILKMGDFLLVTVQVDLYDRLAVGLESDLVNMINKHNARGVLIDISAVSIVDSFMGRILGNIAQTGIRLTFIDKGPGIKNVEEAMKDGFSTGKSLGVGLPGAKRLVNEFEIKSQVGKGTNVSILKWKNG